MDTKRSPELWDRLSNESGRAYEAFKVFMYMSPAERSVVGAWREWTANPEAARPSPFFEEWGREHAWSERARAHDAHIERLRRGGMEKAIEEEAKLHARQAEQMRYRFNELVTRAYDRAIEWLDDSEWTNGNFRSGDIIKLIQIHLDATERLREDARGAEVEDDWSEAEEDEEGDRILAELAAEREARRAAGDDSEPEEDLL